MENEFETKVLDINVQYISSKLESLGAIKEKEIFFRRRVLDMQSDKREWFRIRDDGNTCTITYKCRNTKEIGSTEEIEMIVENFEKAEQMFGKLKFKNKYYQENKRQIYRIDDVEFSFDTWPMIPTFLEVESINKESVEKGLALIDLAGKDVGDIGTPEVYAKYGIDLHSYEVLKFQQDK